MAFSERTGSPRSVRVSGDDYVFLILVPSEEAANCNHQHDAGKANRKLHRNVVADGGQQDLAEHREQDPEAEHLQRMLAAADDQSSNRSVQEPVVAPHEMTGSDGKRQETDQAQRRQIGLVVDQRREFLQQQTRKCLIGVVDSPRNMDDRHGDRNADGKLRKPRALGIVNT